MATDKRSELNNLIDQFNQAVGGDKTRLFVKLQEFAFEDIKDVLLEALKDNNHKVRATAARMIGKLGDETVVPNILYLMYEDSWIIRSSAQEALTYLPADIVLPALRGLVSTPGGDTSLRKSLASVISQYDGSEAAEILVRMFRDADDNQLKAALIEFLGKRKEELAIEVVFNALKDESWDVRNAAIKIIGQMDINLIISRAKELLSDPNRQVHMAIVEIMIRNASDIVIDAMAEILTKGSTLGRLNALNVLNGIHNDECLMLIVSALSDKISSVRFRAIEILANSRSPVVFQLLKRCLKSTNWNLKQGAVKTLASLATDESIDLLEDLLKEDSVSVKVSVLEALAGIGSRRCVRIITQHTSLPELGEDAIRIIKSLDADRAIPHLISFLAETNFFEHTMRALRELERAKVLRYLASRVASGTPAQQIKSLEAIGRLGGIEAEQYLKKMLDAPFSNELKKSIQAAVETIQKRIG